MLKEGRVAIHNPTLHPSLYKFFALKDSTSIHFNYFIILDQDELIIGKIRFKTFDLGGHETGNTIKLYLLVARHVLSCKFSLARKLWRDYFASGVDGVVFIVDAVDRARFPEAKKELDV